MDAHDTEIGHRTWGILGWLGLGSHGEQELETEQKAAADAPPDPRFTARRHLLGDITSFMEVHDLSASA